MDKVLKLLPEKCECGSTEFTWEVVKTVVLERSEGDHVWRSGEDATDVKCSFCDRLFIEASYLVDAEVIDQLVDA